MALSRGGVRTSFVTAQGSAYTRLRRALDHSNLTEALAAASELPHVGLVEALELVLLLCDKAPENTDPRFFCRVASAGHRAEGRWVDRLDPTRRGPADFRNHPRGDETTTGPNVRSGLGLLGAT